MMDDVHNIQAAARLLFDEVSKSQRRITNPRDITSEKRYMAYLVRTAQAPRKYDAWLCGGAIISSLLIVTSAACIEDVDYMYAIAGYDTYVPAHQIDEDECTKRVKKKVVFHCVPKAYEMDYARVEKWAFVDIGIVRVESPYNFDAIAKEPHCSWVPNQIEISFDGKHQVPDTDVMVLGWGHSKEWRKASDKSDLNQKKLKYAPTLIVDREYCKKSYAAVKDLEVIIDKYMICTYGEGNIDAEGRMINPASGLFDGCQEDPDSKCIPVLGQYGPLQYYFRRDLDINKGDFPNDPDQAESSTSASGLSSSSSDYTSPMLDIGLSNSGICQNDHGGPLITWVGKREVLIGVASVFLVDAKDRSCVGPNLHTSTQCNGAFVACVIGMFPDGAENPKPDPRKAGARTAYETPEQAQDRRTREDMNQRYQYMVMMNRRTCESPPEDRGFDIDQRRISWMHHPDGPAHNELSENETETEVLTLRRQLLRLPRGGEMKGSEGGGEG